MAFMAATAFMAEDQAEALLANTEALEEEADQDLRQSMLECIRSGAGAQIPSWLARDNRELEEIKCAQAQAFADMQRRTVDELGPVTPLSEMGNPSRANDTSPVVWAVISASTTPAR
jgi:hypothetical protein